MRIRLTLTQNLICPQGTTLNSYHWARGGGCFEAEFLLSDNWAVFSNMAIKRLSQNVIRCNYGKKVCLCGRGLMPTHHFWWLCLCSGEFDGIWSFFTHKKVSNFQFPIKRATSEVDTTTPYIKTLYAGAYTKPRALGVCVDFELFYVIFELFHQNLDVYTGYIWLKTWWGLVTLWWLRILKMTLELFISNLNSPLRSLYDHPFCINCIWEKLNVGAVLPLLYGGGYMLADQFWWLLKR